MAIKITLFLIITLTMLFTNSCEYGQKEVVIPKSKIQKEVNKKFPVHEEELSTSITIDTPDVYFEDENIGLKSSYYGSFFNKEVKGIVDFNGQVIYKNGDGSFYLTNFNLVNFTANSAELSNEETLRSLISTLMRKYLDNYPIYKLDRSKFKGKVADFLIKDVQTKGDNLVLILGL